VVLPVRDGAATIGAQLRALSQQDYAGPWELIVVENGSRDDTLAIVSAHARRHGRIRLLAMTRATKSSVGPAAARNHGARAARGDLLAFCDADDVVGRGWLTGLAAGSRHGDIVAGALELISLNPTPVLAWQHAPAWQRRAPRPRPHVSSANCAVWADVLHALGGFDENQPGAEDKDLAWRAQADGHHVHVAPAAVVAYRLRTSLRATAAQRYRWGRSEPRLYRAFDQTTIARPRPADALRCWAWSLAVLPTLPWSAERRGRWTVRTAQLAGRAVGSARERVLFL
jgi:glycosyltransferase involved in cell wall biosynthesis